MASAGKLTAPSIVLAEEKFSLSAFQAPSALLCVAPSAALLSVALGSVVRQQWLDGMEPEPECVKCRCESQLSGSLDAPENLNGQIKRGDSNAALPSAGPEALSAPSASWQTALNAVVPCCVVLR